jgi:tRNA pseudouridine38/39 synthase
MRGMKGPKLCSSGRFSTKSRTYKYLFVNPSNYLNIEQMLEAAKALEGEHDFRNFCKLDVNVSHWIRSIMSIQISPFSSFNLFGSEDVEELPSNQSELASTCFVCTITGSGFLWHQIRCIMYILFLVGTGREEPSVS